MHSVPADVRPRGEGERDELAARAAARGPEMAFDRAIREETEERDRKWFRDPELKTVSR